MSFLAGLDEELNRQRDIRIKAAQREEDKAFEREVFDWKQKTDLATIASKRKTSLAEAEQLSAAGNYYFRDSADATKVMDTLREQGRLGLIIKTIEKRTLEGNLNEAFIPDLVARVEQTWTAANNGEPNPAKVAEIVEKIITDPDNDLTTEQNVADAAVTVTANHAAGEGASSKSSPVDPTKAMNTIATWFGPDFDNYVKIDTAANGNITLNPINSGITPRKATNFLRDLAIEYSKRVNSGEAGEDVLESMQGRVEIAMSDIMGINEDPEPDTGIIPNTTRTSSSNDAATGGPSFDQLVKESDNTWRN